MGIVLALLLFFFPFHAISDEIKFVHFAPPTHPVYKSVDFFKKYIEKRSSGAIKVMNCGHRIFGDEQRKMEGILKGDFQIGAITTSLLSNIALPMAVCDLPFIWKNRISLYRLLDTYLFDRLSPYLEEKGLVLLGWCENGFRCFSSTVRPIHRPEDLSGLVVRTLNSKIYRDMYKILGAEVKILPFDEIIPSLKKGYINTVDIPLYLIFLSGLVNHIRYITISDWSYMGCAVVANLNWFSNLPRDLQDAIREGIYEMQIYNRSLSMESELENCMKAMDAGIKVNWLSEKAKEAFRSRLQPIYKEWSYLVGREIIEKILNHKVSLP